MRYQLGVLGSSSDMNNFVKGTIGSISLVIGTNFIALFATKEIFIYVIIGAILMLDGNVLLFDLARKADKYDAYGKDR